MARLSARSVRPLLLLALVLAGCGPPELWQRWRAERAMFRARLEDGRARAAGSTVTGAQLERARRAYQRVERAFPLERWVARATAGDTLARDVARVSAAAATRAAELEAALGRVAAARAELDRVASVTAPVWPSAFEARLALAGVLERAGDSTGALPAWEAAARHASAVDPDSQRVCTRWFVAAHRVADAHRRAGRAAAVDSLWRAMTVEVDRALAANAGDSLAPALWLRRAETRLGSGDAAAREEARTALLHVLGERHGEPFAIEAMLGLGEVGLLTGAPDSAVAWSRRAAAISGPFDMERIFELEVRGWEAAGLGDSAAAALDRLAETRHLPLGVSTVARYREGLRLEQLGHWDLARTAYHTVIASDPLHPASFDSMERLVLHHIASREPVLVEEEANWGLEHVERTLDTVRDPDVRVRALQTRARLRGWKGDEIGALAGWEALWREAPGRPEGVEAGFEAAAIAVHLNDRVRAANLYDALSRQAPRAATRDSAKRAAAALGPAE